MGRLDMKKRLAKKKTHRFLPHHLLLKYESWKEHGIIQHCITNKWQSQPRDKSLNFFALYYLSITQQLVINHLGDTKVSSSYFYAFTLQIWTFMQVCTHKLYIIIIEPNWKQLKFLAESKNKQIGKYSCNKMHSQPYQIIEKNYWYKLNGSQRHYDEWHRKS